jgi:hypothetical protein
VERRFGADIDELLPSLRGELAVAEERLAWAPEQLVAKERLAAAAEKTGAKERLAEQTAAEERLPEADVITDLRDLIDVKRFYELILAENYEPTRLAVRPVQKKTGRGLTPTLFKV